MYRMLVICLALALASTSYGVSIGNWDDGTSQGWVMPGDWGGSDTLVYGEPMPSGNGVGLATVDSGTGFHWDALLATWNSGALTAGNVIGNYSKLEFDVERDWSATSDWGQIHVKIEIQYDDGGSGLLVGQQYDDVSLYNGYWSGEGLQVNHIVLDFSSLIYTGETIWNYQICIATNTNSAIGEGTVVTYWDNMELTPEPATMALLGLGGLALIRRKK